VIASNYYTGRELDAETGLYFYRSRYYDPSVGRFLSEDPIGFGAQDANLYRYVGNSPTNFIDPMGLQTSMTGDMDDPLSAFAKWLFGITIGAALVGIKDALTAPRAVPPAIPRRSPSLF
jgi:RHS repeat-associated protein